MKNISKYKKLLEDYPVLNFCLKDFFDWIETNWEAIPVEKDLFILLEENDHKSLVQLEARLAEAQRELSVSLGQFSRMFGFKKDLLSKDEEKIYDILAEPILVSDLLGLGFRNIKKLSKSIKNKDKSHVKCADFTAEYNSTKFAIELKTIRMENKPSPTPGKPIGDSLIPGWWHTMFINNFSSKIKDKNYGVLKQLENTASKYQCDKKMLAIYNRRISSSTLLNIGDFNGHAKKILAEYTSIDYVLVKNYFGGICIHPQLP